MKLNKQLKIEIVILIIGLTVLGLGIFFFNKSIDNGIRADIAEERLSSITETINIKYKSDSINLYNQFNNTLRLKDSAYNYVKVQLGKEKQIIKYYDAKINYSQTAPITVIDKQFDSLLTVLRHRFNR